MAYRNPNGDPDDESDDCQGHYNRDEVAGYSVGNLLNLGFGKLCFVNHTRNRRDGIIARQTG